MNSFRTPSNGSISSRVQSGQVNRFSTIKKQKRIDLSDPNLFPNLDGTINDTPDSGIQEDIPASSSNSTEDCEYSALQKVTEMSDGQVYAEEFTVESSVIPLGLPELSAEESEWAPCAPNALL